MLEIIFKILPSIVGAIVGGFSGFISSYFMWKTQTRYAQRNIAYALYAEVNVLEQRLDLIVKNSKNLPPFFLGIPPREQRPFYTKDGCFFSFKKEISSFNVNLSNSIFEFYMCIWEAEELRQQVDSDSKIEEIIRETNRWEEIKNLKENFKYIQQAKNKEGSAEIIVDNQDITEKDRDAACYQAVLWSTYTRIWHYLETAYSVLPNLKILLKKEMVKR